VQEVILDPGTSLKTWGTATLLVVALTGLAGCGQTARPKPTPEAIKQFLQLRGYQFDGKGFLAAAAANDVVAVNGFLDAGIDPNVKDDDGATALISGAWHGNEEIVAALLRGGADVNLKDNAGFTAILRALQNKHDGVATSLLAEPKLDVNVQAPTGPTILMTYVWREENDIVKHLLARGANPNLHDEEGDTALHGAALRGNVDLLKLLLDAGANPNARNKLGGTALMWAGSYGAEEAARVLLERGADPSLKDNDGMTAAAWAAKNKRDDVAQFLRAAEKGR
jgi:ankyrin repeat protein